MSRVRVVLAPLSSLLGTLLKMYRTHAPSDELSNCSDDEGSYYISSDESDDELDFLDPEDAHLADTFAFGCAIVPRAPSPLRAPPVLTRAQEIQEDYERDIRDAELAEVHYGRPRQDSSASVATLVDTADNVSDSGAQPKPTISQYLNQSIAFNKFLGAQDDTQARILDVYEYMLSKQVNLPILLNSFCGGSPGILKDAKLRWGWQALMKSSELPDILEYMHVQSVPKRSKAPKTTAVAKTYVKSVALKLVEKTIGQEMRALKPFMRMPVGEITEEALLAITMEDMIAQVTKTAPTLWSILKTASLTSSQAARNTMKNPEPVESCLLSYWHF